MSKIVCFFLIGLSLTLPGCNSGISDRSLVFVMPDDAAVIIKEGERAFLGDQKAIVLVDPRPTWSYRKGHIPQAINIPFGQLKHQMWQLDDAGIIIIAGETYNDAVALAMSKSLIEHGFKDVRTLRGGLTGWEDAGKPISANQ